MKPIPAFNYPHLLVYPDGEVFDTSIECFLAYNIRQGISDSPVISCKNQLGKIRYLNVKTLVAECYVLKRKLKKGERVLSKDSNPENINASNLRIETKKMNFVATREPEENTHGWMNGVDDQYC